MDAPPDALQRGTGRVGPSIPQRVLTTGSTRKDRTLLERRVCEENRKREREEREKQGLSTKHDWFWDF